MWLLLALGACSGTPDGDVKPTDADLDGVSAARDCDDADATVHPGAIEQCNGHDDDCDELVDDADPSLDRATTSPWYPDADGDTYGDPRSPVSACAAPPGYADDALDCDDTDREIRPGAAERCDGVDNDCHGGVDDGLPLSTWYLDLDGDGYGSDASATSACAASPVYVELPGDCDDSRLEIHPGATELCNTVDDDCDGWVNDGLPRATYYPDTDGDGYGAETGGVTTCRQPHGFAPTNSDCNDGNALIHPAAPEECNERDDNCNGRLDELATTPRWFLDEDGDRHGSADHPVRTCNRPGPRYVANASDCDDADAAVYPSADEACDERDNNCDGLVDTDDPFAMSWQDDDGDGAGDASAPLAGCPEGSAPNHWDCDDADPARHPFADEACDDVDDDCDGTLDDVPTEDKTVWYPDADGDGLGAYDGLTRSCTAPSADAVLTGGDCDDTDPAVGSCAVSGSCAGEAALTSFSYYLYYEPHWEESGCVGTLTLTVDAAAGTITGALSCGRGLSGGKFASARLEGTTDGAHAAGTITDLSGVAIEWAGNFSLDGTLTLEGYRYGERNRRPLRYWRTWDLTAECVP